MWIQKYLYYLTNSEYKYVSRYDLAGKSEIVEGAVGCFLYVLLEERESIE